MKKKQLSSILLVILSCSISLTEAFSQDDQIVAANDLLVAEISPNYQYEYIPDFTYEQINTRVKAMDIEMSF